MSTPAPIAPRFRAWTVVCGSYFSYLLFVFFGAAQISRGLGFALPTLFVLVVVPLLDALSGESRDEFKLASFTSLQRLLVAAAPIGFVIGYSGIVVIVASHLGYLTVLEKLLVTLSVGMIGSIAITAAHELVHKPRTFQKAFGRLGLLNVCYLHFEINHIEGHHVWIGTDRDESTAWRGESLYHFIMRTVPGCLRLSWRLERRRLEHRGISILSPRNRMLKYLVAQLLYVATIYALSGFPGVIFFFLQSAVAVFMLESVAFIEHYGLTREKLPSGRYTSTSQTHSWDSYCRFSNYLEFHLQRHADHHAAPARPQEFLRISPQAPRLPAGYPVMTILAMLPPLWRRVMDAKLSSSVGATSFPCGDIATL